MSVRGSRRDHTGTGSESESPSTDATPRRVGHKDSTLELVFGSVSGRGRPEDFDRLISEVKEERAERLLKKLQDDAAH